MRRFPSIKKNTDFQRVYKSGRSSASSSVVMYVMENEPEGGRIGISCSRKVGNSVVRHTLARKFREIYRLNRTSLKPGVDIVLVVRPAAASKTYKELEKQFLYLCGRHHILIQAGSEN